MNAFRRPLVRGTFYPGSTSLSCYHTSGDHEGRRSDAPLALNQSVGSFSVLRRDDSLGTRVTAVVAEVHWLSFFVLFQSEGDCLINYSYASPTELIY